MNNKLKTIIGLLCSFSLSLSVFSHTATASTAMQADVADQQQQSITQSTENQRYGNWLFKGGFKGEAFSAINPEYRISQGDNLLVQLWGGIDHQAEIPVDAQGNIFIPKVGPIKVLGVKNADLNHVILKSVKRVYKSNVEVYVSLVSSQKVKIFLSGMVVKPGLYEGQSADSVLRFIDQAGGIRQDMGSYRQIQVKRNNKQKYQLDLYAFLQKGEMPAMQLQDADVIFVGPKQAEVTLEGEVGFSGKYELTEHESLQSVLDAVVMDEDATHITIIAPERSSNSSNGIRKVEARQYPINQIANIRLQAGALIKVTSQLRATSISIELIGEHNSAKEIVLPWGANLADLQGKIEYSRLSNKQAIQLYRKSVAQRQKDMLQASLTALEQSVLTARSETKEAALLRKAEAEVILQWVAKARKAEPKGQVLLSEGYDASKIILNQGDTIVIPAKRNLVMIHGEVLFPTAIAYNDSMSIMDFIDKSGGATKDIDDMNVLVMKPNGSFVDMNDLLDEESEIEPGDEIFVLAKPDFKGFQLTKDITQLIYQLAMSTAVVLAL
ncbi:polysaccharide biosynthesis/export family protein [Shewanella violacea]|uniref:Polysialic acid transport protein KpsD n=1 Tax=Shewanella violacea (strain JCM 10179 / CIP 106290 / LMG 19151 / DSS12) TaxID=637905 RepID=D4ZFY8_SHEVD|nr:polysaccharide biosynthesis/export family protein [Shewanella violacea]BAJ00587.1 polysialic acid transport protein KpsD [Shewanella violacea DSS12]